MVDKQSIEVVLQWTPEVAVGVMAFTVNEMELFLDELALWVGIDAAINDVVGTVKVVVKPAGFVASLPEHEGW